MYEFGFARDETEAWGLVVRHSRDKLAVDWVRPACSVNRELRLLCLRKVPEILEMLVVRVTDLVAVLEAGRPIAAEINKVLQPFKKGGNYAQ